MNGIRYIDIKKQEIAAYLDNDTFWNQSVLPVSRQRLYAHSQNTAAKDDDVVLMMAYNNEKLVGYIGAFPDYILVNDVKDRIAWLSTWWADPDESGIGWILLRRMYKAYHTKIGVSSFTPDAKKVFDISGYFIYFPTLIGVKAYLNLNFLPELPKKNVITRVFYQVAKSVINPINSLRLSHIKLKIKKRIKNVKINYCSYVDDGTMRFINAMQKDNLLKRDQSFFNYLKSYKWLLESPIAEFDPEAGRYIFSSLVKHFDYYNIKVCNNVNEVIGFIVLSKRDDELKVLYVYFNPEYSDVIVDVIFLHAISVKASILKSFESEINDKINSRKRLMLYKSEISRDFIVSKSFGIEDTTKYKVHTGDGDYCFT